MEDKVKIIQAGGEDTEIIYKAVREFIGDRVDVISSMLSMTFFWQSSEKVQALANTISTNIKPDGKFIFLTMDGTLVQQTFEPAFNTGPAIDTLDLGVAVLNYKGDLKPKELHIDIKGSIVQNQREWLVYLDDLRIRLANYGFNFTKMEKADNEKFLTEEEITMTQMYTYGTLEKLEEKPQLPEITDIKTKTFKKEETDIPIYSATDELTEVTSPQDLPSVKDDELLQEFQRLTISEDPSVHLPPLPPEILPGITSPIEIQEKMLLGLYTNQTEIIKISWYEDEEVVRIGNIKDGSCFLHSILNGCYPDYQNKDEEFRKVFVQKLRRDLASYLEILDDTKIKWETVVDGEFESLYRQQLQGINFKDKFDYPIDFSLKGLQRTINSSQYLSNELFQYISNLLELDIYIMKLTDKDLYVDSIYTSKEQNRKSIVINGDGSFYDTIGIRRNNLIQAVFLPDDEFIKNIKLLINDH